MPLPVQTPKVYRSFVYPTLTHLNPGRRWDPLSPSVDKSACASRAGDCR